MSPHTHLSWVVIENPINNLLQMFPLIPEPTLTEGKLHYILQSSQSGMTFASLLELSSHSSLSKFITS